MGDCVKPWATALFVAVLDLALLVPMSIAGTGEVGRLVGIGSMDIIIVWRDGRTMEEGLNLARAKVSDTRAFRGLAACFVDAETRVMMRSRELGPDLRPTAYDITVVEGPAAGCRGRVPALLYRAPK